MHTLDWQSIDAPHEGEAAPFELHATGAAQQGFVVRFHGRLYAYLNRCPHAGSPLDWVPGRFFSADGRHLACHTHGALFAPQNGECISGPCPHGLTALPLRTDGTHCQVPLQLDTAP